MSKIKLLINGEFVESASGQYVDVTNPATGDIIAQVPLSSQEETDRAVTYATQAFQSWKKVPVTERARVMMRYQAILKREQQRIATVLAGETGKVFDDAMGDVWRGIEVVEQAMNAPSMMMGETVENVSNGIDTHSIIQPLGVCVGITPFNFPAMIPLWMFPLAIVCGNTFVLKPSEQDPQTPMLLAELFIEAGAPPGVLNIIHGGKDQVDQLLTHKDVKAVSFVGSVPVGEHVYRTATQNLKRAQCFAGAKNHTVVMPDANKQHVINNLVGASVGAAGQRCMAISVAVFVGTAQQWIEELAAEIAKVKPGIWDDNKAGFGPLISASAKSRVQGLIASGKEEGANCLVDGSQITVSGYERGHWIGPTVFTDVTTDMRIYKEEIFGPVLCCLCVDTLEDALDIVNSNPYGNGTSIFTASGAAARKYQSEVEVGQVGINVPIPVPLPFFSFTGWKNSFFGDLHAYGKQAVRFYTETKTITSRWPEDSIPAGPNLTINLR